MGPEEEEEEEEDVVLVSSDPPSSPISESLTPRPRARGQGRPPVLVTAGGVEYDLEVLKGIWPSLPLHIQRELEPLRRSAAAARGGTSGSASTSKRKAPDSPAHHDDQDEEAMLVTDDVVEVASSQSPARPAGPPPLPAAPRTPHLDVDTTAGGSEGMSFPTPSQIDPAIFEALPRSVQKEIRLVNRVKRAFRPPRFGAAGAKPATAAAGGSSRTNSREALGPGIGARQDGQSQASHPLPPDLAGARTPQELRATLITWTQQPPTPARREQLDAFAAALIRHKDLERLVLLLRMARRLCTGPEWADFYAILLPTIQCTLREEYGWELEEFA